MIICHIDTKSISYSPNPLFVLTEETQFDWTTGMDYKVTDGNALPYGLTLEWQVSHQNKDTEDKIVECDIPFRVGFDLGNESRTVKTLPGIYTMLCRKFKPSSKLASLNILKCLNR